jgi:hypothetical protein
LENFPLPIAKHKIKVRIDYSKESHAAYAVFVAGVLANMVGNPHFPKLPVSLALLQTLLDQYKTLSAAALDGGRTILSQRNSLRDQIDKLVRQLAHYVEAASANAAIFATSGLEALPSSYAPAEHLPPQTIVDFAHGAISGTILLYLPPSRRRIIDWQIRYAIAASPNAVPDSWTIELFIAQRNPYSISGLQPGATYVFQIRAFGKLGFSDWGAAATFICT